jgi:hypothetical protein
MRHHEKGQALPLAIMALAIGTLVITPFVGHASSSLIGSITYGEAIAHRSASDAGVEHAIWSLTRGSLAEQIPEAGDEVTYQLGETLNGVTTSITVTANATKSDVVVGDIGDTIIDSLEFDTSDGFEPDMVHVSGDIYAIAYRGSGSDGFLRTASIAPDGHITNFVIDTLEFDTSDGYEPDIIHISGNIYAIAYRGSGHDGFLKTVSIASDGHIANWVIDTLEYDTSNGYEPCIIHVSGNIFAIAYRGSGSDGFLKTVSIAPDGHIANFVIDTLEYDTSNGYEPDIIYISGNVYAIAYRGSGNDGFLKTVSIAPDGHIANSVIDTLEFDTSDGYEPDIIYISGNVYAIVYRGPGNDGFLKTVSIASDGHIANSVIDTLEFATYVYDPSITPVVGNVYAVAYLGARNNGFLRTIGIAADGSITATQIDVLAFDGASGYEPVIIQVSGDIYAIVYRGVNSDGFVVTVAIAAQGSGRSSAAYSIVASAGDTTIRAFVNTTNTTVSIVSWYIEGRLR